MKPSAKYKVDIPLLFIVLLSAFLNGYDIWKDKYVNTFYTTAVAAMLQSWHNFFYGSLDSAGSVTVDKPPVTFWIQTLFAKIFGLHGWSVILPQALAGIGSVLLVYMLVKRTFGLTAARIGALAMACTPIAAAVSRTNNIDSMLVFTLLVGAALLLHGIRKGRAWGIIAAFAVVGIAFNMKMLQAYMVLPAFYLLLIVAGKWGWKRKAGIMAGATAILLVVSLSWAVVVDAIPADKRPFIGSSGTNSVLNLAFGYNGVSRLTGDRSTGGGFGDASGGGRGFPTGAFNGQDAPTDPFGSVGENGAGTQPGGGALNPEGGRDSPFMRNAEGNNRNFRQDGGASNNSARNGGGFGGGGPNGGGGGMFNTGAKGPLRLFQASLSGQASWLIPFAAFGAIALLAGMRRRNWTEKQKETLFWLAWLLPVGAFFSVAGFFHSYYLVMMAPPVAALVGAGFVEMWQAYRERSDWRGWLLPAAMLATTAFEWYIMHPYAKTIGSGWPEGIALAGLILTAGLVAWRARGSEGSLLYRAWPIVGVLLLFVGPLYWAATPITYGMSSMVPAAGPTAVNDRSGGMRNGGFNIPNGGAAIRGQAPGPESGTGVNEALWSYLKAHNTGEKYLMATSDYSTAAPYMIDKGEHLVILNGFNNSDQVYTVDSLKALIAKGEVKYFLLSSGGMGGGWGGNSEVTQWIQKTGKAISASEYETTAGTVTGNGRFGGGSGTLYEIDLK